MAVGETSVSPQQRTASSESLPIRNSKCWTSRPIQSGLEVLRSLGWKIISAECRFDANCACVLCRSRILPEGLIPIATVLYVSKGVAPVAHSCTILGPQDLKALYGPLGKRNAYETGVQRVGLDVKAPVPKPNP